MATIKSRLKKLGLTMEWYESEMANTTHCPICLKPKDGSCRFVVDHCHVTGRFRNIICEFCNTSLGLMRDNPESLRRAANYLENRS